MNEMFQRGCAKPSGLHTVLPIDTGPASTVLSEVNDIIFGHREGDVERIDVARTRSPLVV
jgi:hypothetical protein